MFDDLGEMRQAIRDRDKTHGLARLGCWVRLALGQQKGQVRHTTSRIDGCQLRWNSAETDWINSKGSVDEVGSIHTVQGYDLNYAGVIIGSDLRFDPAEGHPYFDRASYFDKKGRREQPPTGHHLQRQGSPAVRDQHLLGAAHSRHARHLRLRRSSRPARAPSGTHLTEAIFTRPFPGILDSSTSTGRLEVASRSDFPAVLRQAWVVSLRRLVGSR